MARRTSVSGTALHSPVTTGLKIRLEIPKFFLPYLEILDNQSVGLAIREAVRSAGRPYKAALKTLIAAEMVPNPQSTGATERAVDMKYGRSKSNPRRFYAIVGINTTHFEYHTATPPNKNIATFTKKGKKQRGAGLFGLQTRMNKRRQLKSKIVFSRYRDPVRIAKLGGRAFKRKPRKYFHLIDKGFMHHSGKQVEGYDFIRKLQLQMGDTAQNIFRERLRNLVLPVIRKETLRKYANVLK